MNTKLYDSPHTVYGLIFDKVLFYIGCTHDMEKRKRGLFMTFNPLKRNRDKISMIVLAECPNKRSGNLEETRRITEQIIKGNKFLANAIPSATINEASEELKVSWRDHQMFLGGAFPGTQYRKRGFGNWSEMAFNKILNALSK